MQIEERRDLAHLTTFGIGGPARWFAEAATEAEIAEASGWALARGVPLFVLGGGSNVLIADEGFPGLVLHVGLKGIEREGELFRVGAGENWDDCVRADSWSKLCGDRVPGRNSGNGGRNSGAERGRLRAGGGFDHRARAGIRSG